MKKYVIILSKTFPQGHSKAGRRTFFREKMQVALGCPQCGDEQDLSGENITHCNSCMYATMQPKLHTIRGNYALWKKRIGEVNRGEACISLREWSGKPYRSQQREIAVLTSGCVGIQRLDVSAYPYTIRIDDDIYTKSDILNCIAKNDGLTQKEWVEWFGKCDLFEPLAIIHFTNFRY